METVENINLEALYEQEQRWCELVDSWQRQVEGNDDFGYLEAEFTNSIYAEHSFEWAHYGYSRRDHQHIEGRFDLDYNNACLIKYTIRQSDYALGPSGDIHKFIGGALAQRGYHGLGTTSDDEYGTHLTYWYLKEFCEPKDNPEFDWDNYEPYDRWDDPYGDEEY